MPGASDTTAGSTVANAIEQAGELRSARIESLRALAAIGVVWTHIYSTSIAYRSPSGFGERLLMGGRYGVFLFFGLSGYLLYWPFARHYFGEGASLDLRRYAVNRALRILPLYWVAVAVLLALGANGGQVGDWWRYALFLQNYSPDTILRLDSPMWSLAVEVQFYLLLPLIAAGLAAASRRSLKAAAGLLALIGLASFVLYWTEVSHAAVIHGTSPLLGPFAFPTTFFYFAVGMLLALLRLAWRRTPDRLPRPLVSTDAWLATAVALWLVGVWHFRLDFPIAIASFLVVGACILPLRPGRLMRVLEWRPLAVIGVASYSLYLWHAGIIPWVDSGHVDYPPTGGGFTYVGEGSSLPVLFAVAFPLSIAVALASYALIEAPFLRLRERWSSGVAGPVPVAPAAESQHQD